MNCREFENEFSERAALGDAATLHVRDCFDCQKTRNELTQLWQMFESLPTVNAPDDFNFRLKGRMAQTTASNIRPRWQKYLHLSAPISALVLLGFLVLAAQNFFVSDSEISGVVVEKTSVPTGMTNQSNALNSQTVETITPRTESNLPNLIEGNRTTDKEFLPPVSVAEKSPGKNIAPPFNSKAERKLVKSAGADEPAGSTTSSVRSAPVFTPKGIPVMQPEKIETQSELTSGKKISVIEILEAIGIEVENAQMPPRVKTLKANSIAENSGIQNEDVIEEIDDIRLNNKENIPSFSGVKSLKINRAGKIIQLILKPDRK